MFNIDEISKRAVEAGDVKVTPCPEGDYRAVVRSYRIDERQHDKMRDGQPFLELAILWDIDSDQVRQFLQQQSVLVRQQIILDVTKDDAGNDILDMSKGKNVTLNRLRDASSKPAANPNPPFSTSRQHL